MGHHERSDPVVDLQDLRRQVRWLRHAVERLTWILGLTCGIAIAGAVTAIILKMGAI